MADEISLCFQFKKQFDLENFKMTMLPEEIAAFADSPVLGLQKFMIYRSFVATYWVALFWWSWGDMMDDGDAGYYWIYLTHWTLVFEMIYLVLAAVATIRMPFIRYQLLDELKEKENPDARLLPPILIRVLWTLQNIVFTASLIVFLLFWLLVYTPGDHLFATTPQTHGVNFILMAVDVILSGASHRILQFYWPVVYAIIYTIWSIIFSGAKMTNEAGDGYIYEAIDWNGNFASACTTIVIVIFFAVPFLHFLLWFLVSIKTLKFGGNTKWMKKCLEDAPDTQPVLPSFIRVHETKSDENEVELKATNLISG